MVLVICRLPSTKVVGGNLYGGACTWSGMPLPSNNCTELNSAGSWSVELVLNTVMVLGVKVELEWND